MSVTAKASTLTSSSQIQLASAKSSLSHAEAPKSSVALTNPNETTIPEPTSIPVTQEEITESKGSNNMEIEEEAPIATLDKEAARPIEEEQPVLESDEEGLNATSLEIMGNTLWKNLDENQRNQVQGLVDFLRIQQATKTSALRKKLASAQEELEQMKIKEAETEKRNTDEFIRDILDIVSACTDVNTQTVLQKALASLPESASIAQRASVLSPYVKQVAMSIGTQSKEDNPFKKDIVQKATKSLRTSKSDIPSLFRPQVNPARAPEKLVQKRASNTNPTTAHEKSVVTAAPKKRKMNLEGFNFNLLNSDRPARNGHFTFDA